jgi:hypothetical protein
MPNIISFSFHYERKAYIAVIFRQYYKSMWMKVVSAGGIFSLFICLLYLFEINPLRFTIFPLFALLYGLLTLLIPALLWWRMSSSLRKSWILDKPVSVTLTNQKMLVQSGEFSKTIQKSDILKTEILGSDILIYTTRTSFFYIPGSQLNTIALDAVINWLNP